MWTQIVEFFKQILGGKGTTQIGKGQQAVTGTTSGEHSPVINAGGNVNYNASPTPTDHPVSDRDAELFAEMLELMPEIIQSIRELLFEDPLLRDLVVMERSGTIFNFDRPHGRFNDDTHPDASRKFGILESHGLLRRRKEGLFEISPRFVRMLKTTPPERQIPR